MPSTVDRGTAEAGPHWRSGDGMRAMGLLGVIAYHCAFLAAPDPHTIKTFAQIYGEQSDRLINLAGEGAVTLFFAITGYLVGRPFVSAYIEGRRPPSVTNHVVRRTFRLVPCYWLVITFLLTTRNYEGLRPFDAVRTYLFDVGTTRNPLIGDIGQAWTLTLEAWFCVLLPFAAYAGRRWAGLDMSLPDRGRRAVAAVATVFALSIVVKAVIRHRPLVDQRGVVAEIWAFMPGVALAAVESVPSWRRALAKRARGFTGAGVVTMIVAAGAYTTLTPHPAFPPRPGWVAPTAMAVFVGSALFALLVMQWGDRRGPRLLTRGPLAWLGAISYPFYLIHQALLQVFTRHLTFLSDGPRTRAVELFIAVLVVGTPIAYALHRLVEEPGRLAAKRVSAWRARRPSPAAGTTA